MVPKYKRAVIKISGEALSGKKGFGIDNDVIRKVVGDINNVRNKGIELGIIIGGGNFWRGKMATGMDRSTADHMGMLATVINALALQDALEKNGIPTRVQTALTITRVADLISVRR